MIANTPSVIVQRIMSGAVVLVYVIVLLSIPVVARDIVLEVGRHAAEKIRVVTVPHITVGMAVPVLIPIVIPVQADIQPRVRG